MEEFLLSCGKKKIADGNQNYLFYYLGEQERVAFPLKC